MTSDENMLSITIETPDGSTVAFDTLISVVAKYRALISAINEAVAPRHTIRWDVSTLRKGSAEVGLNPQATDLGAIHTARTIAETQKNVIKAVEENAYERIEWPRVRVAAGELCAMVGKSVPSFTFGSLGTIARVVTPPTARQMGRESSLGSITGVLEAPNGRGDLQFILYDDLFGRGVRCFLGDNPLGFDLRRLWQERVEVTGRLTSDTVTGVVTQVHDITSIHELDTSSADYRKTEGMWKNWESSLEDRIEALRDVRRGE
jgi:hypothetical protein